MRIEISSIRQSPRDKALWNKQFSKQREENLASLHRDLKLPPGDVLGVDPNIRPIAEEFARLPYAYIRSSCEGRFGVAGGGRDEEVHTGQLEGISSNERICHTNDAHFEIVANHSKEARALLRGLKRLTRRTPYLMLGGQPTSFQIRSHYRNRGEFPKADALKIAEDHMKFVKAFEGLVKRWVRKSGRKA
jgi:hypothetical protein